MNWLLHRVPPLPDVHVSSPREREEADRRRKVLEERMEVIERRLRDNDRRLKRLEEHHRDE